MIDRRSVSKAAARNLSWRLTRVGLFLLLAATAVIGRAPLVLALDQAPAGGTTDRAAQTSTAAPAARADDDTILAPIVDWIDRLETLSARFTQIGPDGGQTTGSLAIHRPGRLRLDYDPPSQILLIAPGDWRLIYYDASIRQVNVLPIGQTPLGVLLDRDLRLGREIEVVEIRRGAGEIAVTLVRRGEAEQGSVTLVFAESPVALRRWTVVDAQGLATHVVLEDVKIGVPLDPSLFHWRDPAIFGLPAPD
ncbi:MAG: outer membrane lipoprotein carrier protein LolA [Geminicoccaceae bacterium]|nr:outer membrane lipoprotein carrier protein LolA [Geminicoccaceae bacterium]